MLSCARESATAELNRQNSLISVSDASSTTAPTDEHGTKPGEGDGDGVPAPGAMLADLEEAHSRFESDGEDKQVFSTMGSLSEEESD